MIGWDRKRDHKEGLWAKDGKVSEEGIGTEGEDKDGRNIGGRN